MADLIMCITSGGQKMVGEDYSVPPHPMKPKSALKKWPVFVLRFKHKNRHHHPAFEETGNVANKNSTSTLESKTSS